MGHQHQDCPPARRQRRRLQPRRLHPPTGRCRLRRQPARSQLPQTLPQLSTGLSRGGAAAHQQILAAAEDALCLQPARVPGGVIAGYHVLWEGGRNGAGDGAAVGRLLAAAGAAVLLQHGAVGGEGGVIAQDAAGF